MVRIEATDDECRLWEIAENLRLIDGAPDIPPVATGTGPAGRRSPP